MPYAPTTTWVATDTIEASLLDADLEGIKDFLQKLPSNAMSATAWVDTNHIMKGYYNPTLNLATFVSGVYGGKTYNGGGTDSTYATMYNTDRLGSNPPYVQMPKTAMTFELTSDCTILFQYWMCPITYDDLDATLNEYNDIFIWAGSGFTAPLTSTRCRSIEEDSVTAAFPEHESRRFCAGARLVTGLSAGSYSIGLASRGNAAKTRAVAWGISAQLFAM